MTCCRPTLLFLALLGALPAVAGAESGKWHAALRTRV